jgi:DHA2 family metal-tetracycline-proton antiporter-like MFS transporter
MEILHLCECRLQRFHYFGKQKAHTEDMKLEQTASQTIAVESERLFLFVIASSVFVTTLTGSMINVLLPLIRGEFLATTAQIGWIATGYSLAYAIGVPLYGRISDLFGLRTVFIFGLIGFILGGLLCSIAPNLGILVLGRIIQGAGGAAVPALSSVAVAKVLPPASRGGALGMVGAMVGVGSSVGPIVGGFIGSYVGWRLLFIVSLLLMAIIIPLAQRMLPNFTSDGDRRFDLIGSISLGVGAGLFLFGITQAQGQGFDHWSSWGSFIVALVALSLFVWRINAIEYPFVSPKLFKRPSYVAVLIVGFSNMLCYSAALIFIPLLLIEVNQLEPRSAGFALTAGALAMAISSPFLGKLSDRIGVRKPIIIGMLMYMIVLIGFASFAGASPFIIACFVMLMGLGGACVQPAANSAAANALTREELGGGMGLVTGISFLGGGAGAALIGAFLAARQSFDVPALLPYYAYNAPPFSDSFLAIMPIVAIGIIASFWISNKPYQSDQA